jgi:DNA-directed RNA polymerase specialized sigma24 family protein
VEHQSPPPDLPDAAVPALLAEDPARGWRVFVDTYSPTLLGLIARAGVSDHDDAADVYLQVCERLAANDCARLRQYDARKGALAAWLTVLVRHTIVDWIRARAGRRRLFGAIRRLSRFDQRIFELYYWDHRRPAEIAAQLAEERGTTLDLADVFDGLQRVQEAMSDRHRSELLALVARTRTPVSLGELDDHDPAIPASRDNPERAAQVRELDALFSAALGTLPPEDGAIVRLMFVQGWSRRQVQRALHLEHLTSARLTSVVERLRDACRARRLTRADAATPGLSFLEGHEP